MAYTITQVLREENSKVDALSKLTLATNTNLTKLVPIEFLSELGIGQEENKMVDLVDTVESWMDPVISYLRDRWLYDDK